ncbi:9029_t:CDS:2 [Entrophospora sp. SA101]|nr:9029_t:CDS:2 [Entrophospora sp. SA101]
MQCCQLPVQSNRRSKKSGLVVHWTGLIGLGLNFIFRNPSTSVWCTFHQL